MESHIAPWFSRMNCPRCATPKDEAAIECRACGVIFAKWRSPNPRSEAAVPVAPTRPAAAAPAPWSVRSPPPPPPPETLGITHAGWKATGIGFAMALVLSFFPLLSFLLHPLTTLVHEIGHTAVYWIFGFSAVPAFDFNEGGGATLGDAERSSLITWAWVVGFLALCWWQRENKKVLIALGAVPVIYFMMYNSPRERLAIALGGHGGEILFGTLFLYRALTGWGVKIPVERPLYAFIAFMILFSDLRLASTLMGNSVNKAWYLQGKSYADNDLVLAGIYLTWKIESVARALMAATLLSVPAAIWAASKRRTIGALSEVEEAGLE